MAGSSLLKNKLEEFKLNANDVIHFKLVRDENDVEDYDKSFKPDMTHQVFGEQESIFGYKDLEVKMYYTAAKLNTYLSMSYIDKVTPKRFDGLVPDEVLPKLAQEIPPGYYTNLDDFLATLPKEVNFKPFGEMLHSYKVKTDGSSRNFEVYKTDIDVPGFRDYHSRLQTFLLFFIDAASYIDVDDDRWNYFLVFEKYRNNGETMYAIAGYMTIYNYYAYPNKTRPRISQVLILPPFQRQGHGAELLQTFYNTCYDRDDIMDITVEDPSENFQRLRDFVDCKNVCKLREFQPNNIRVSFNDAMLQAARQKLKLSRRQARRVYEILRLKATDGSNTQQYRDYRLEVKRRLNSPFTKNRRDFQKLKKALNPQELDETMNTTEEKRLEYLEKSFEEHVEVYRQVLDRLAASS
ncbi:hypothetical protein LOTGIDRAFT_232538 [Lottia gigantea]|uniref:Histone acetyltransferase type B catalytic subunit n=1 Tax=Lottia gigantea TaxID=225164 RepID=V4AGL7_LOTGI|nr:hypothetical protein LOTGIDRAFT_232538 [Lottia gigantea]ESO94305.1 hypothetical protein LOTGIDRAFT_232538 [Lottia gigantea]